MSQALVARVRGFVDQHCIPLESAAHVHDPAAMDAALGQLRPVARELGLYLPQMPVQEGGLGLSWVARAAVFPPAKHVAELGFRVPEALSQWAARHRQRPDVVALG